MKTFHFTISLCIAMYNDENEFSPAGGEHPVRE